MLLRNANLMLNSIRMIHIIDATGVDMMIVSMLMLFVISPKKTNTMLLFH